MFHKLKNLTGHSRVAKNMALYFCSRGIDIIAAIIILSSVTRYLGEHIYGKFAFITNLIFVFVPIINFGISSILIREIARDKAHSDEYFGTAVAVRTLLILLCAIFIFTIAYQFPGISMIAIELAMVSEFLLAYSRLNSDLFIAVEKVEYESILTISNRIGLIGVIILIIHYDLGLTGIFASMALINFLTVLLGSGIILKKFIKPRITLSISQIKSLLKDAFPLTLATFLSEITFRLDVFILKILRDFSEIAFFNAPLGLILRLTTISLAFVTVLHPLFSRLATISRSDLLSLYEKTFKVLLAFILPVAIFTTFFAKRISVFIFGAQFINASGSLQFLIWVLLFLFLDVLNGHILVSVHKQKLIALEYIVCFTINFILEILLVPLYGHIGASFSKLIAFGVAFALSFYFVAKNLGFISLINVTIKPLISSLVMISVLYIVKDYNLLLLIVLGNLIYIGGLYVLKIFSKEDIIKLKEILKTA
jgi:O-antigen/teichoic acid export membrane protein